MAHDQIDLGTDDFQDWGDKTNAVIESTWTEIYGNLTNVHIAVYGQSYVAGLSDDGYGAYTTECTTPQSYGDMTFVYGDVPAIGDAISQKVVARSVSGWGPEIFGAKNLKDLAGLDSTWSMCGKGGTSTYQLAKGGAVYTTFLETVAKSKTDYSVGDPDVLIYLQNIGNSPDNFLLVAEVDYTNMFDDLISDFGDIPMFIMSPNDYDPVADSTAVTRMNTLRTIMERVVSRYENLHMLPTDSIPVGSDGSSHFNAEGNKQLGERVADRIMSALSGARKMSHIWERDPLVKTLDAKKVIAQEISSDVVNSKTMNTDESKTLQVGDIYFNGSPLAGGESRYNKQSAFDVFPSSGNFQTWGMTIGPDAGDCVSDGTHVIWRSVSSITMYGQVGQYVVVRGCDPESYNGVWRVSDVVEAGDFLTVECPITDAYVGGAKIHSIQPLLAVSPNGFMAEPNATITAKVKLLHNSVSLGDRGLQSRVAVSDTELVYVDESIDSTTIGMASAILDGVAYIGYFTEQGNVQTSVTQAQVAYEIQSNGMEVTSYVNSILGS